jgi:hypothetical protein
LLLTSGAACHIAVPELRRCPCVAFGIAGDCGGTQLGRGE